MLTNIKKIFTKKFVRNVFVLATGTASAQLINFILVPLITRIYGPEAYGLMGVFISIIFILAPISALTYPIAIVLPKDNFEAKGIAHLSFYTTLQISGIILLILLFFKDFIVELFQLEGISSFLFLIPLVVLFTGITQILEQWFIRSKEFSINAKAVVLQTLIINGSKLSIGLIYPVAGVLIVLSALNSGLKALLMFLFSKRLHKQKTLGIKKQVSIIKLAKKYKDFPIYRAPESLIHAITQSVPVLLLSSFFGPASAGFFSLSRTVLMLPIKLIGQSVGDVFYPRISEAKNNKENLTKIIKKATIYLGLLGIIPFGIIFLFGPWLFGIVFGEEWRMSGEYASWLSLGLFFGFIRQPSIRALPVLSAQKFHFIFALISLTIRIICLVIGFLILKSDLYAVALYSISGGILDLLLILITLKISKNFMDNINKK